MDLDELRERLRRKARTGEQDKVKELWQNLKDRTDLTTKEKLEKLLSLSRQTRPEKKESVFASGDSSRGQAQPFLVLENSFHLNARYGQIMIGLGLNIPGPILAVLGRDEALVHLSLRQAVFLDLETTGLSGGTGTVPFLIGLGFFEDDKYRVVQYFLNDLAAEARMLADLQTFLMEKNFSVVVSYNGKGFDLPILETRFVLSRLPFPLAGRPHLDFLFSARHLWKHKYQSCRLYDLALCHLGVDRAEDIPSEEIPYRYFQYLRTGDFSLVEPIFYHNQEDILSLYGLIVAGAAMVSRSLEEAEVEADGLELLGVGKIWEKAGQQEKSAVFYERALNKKLPGEFSVKVRKDLAYYFKKQRQWEKSIELWQELVEHSEDLDCFRELAIYYEHYLKNPEEALKYALDGLALSEGRSLRYQQDFKKRVERLTRKINRVKLG